MSNLIENYFSSTGYPYDRVRPGFRVPHCVLLAVVGLVLGPCAALGGLVEHGHENWT